MRLLTIVINLTIYDSISIDFRKTDDYQIQKKIEYYICINLNIKTKWIKFVILFNNSALTI